MRAPPLSPGFGHRYEKATFDGEGALVLAGVFKTDSLQVKYRIRYIQNKKVWKLLGINVEATGK